MTRPTTSTSRLFIAVLLPVTLKEEIMKMISELSDVSGDDVRWISEQNLHITLKFFGEVKSACSDQQYEEHCRFVTSRVLLIMKTIILNIAESFFNILILSF